ncbi:MAG: hypothetical protein ACETV1_05075 [Candidatus Bathyarchaeia archaeon]
MEDKARATRFHKQKGGSRSAMDSQVSDCLPPSIAYLQSNCLLEKNKSIDISNSDVTEILERLNLLVNLSCQSASLDPLNVAQKNGDYRRERSQINVFVQTPFGEFKSTIFRSIQGCYPAVTMTDVSFPKLVGSFDIESRTVVPSACWEYRKKTIILDEFHFRQGIINALLGLMEGGEYNRAIARGLAKSTTKKDGDLYFKCSKTGWIKVKTRFNCIIGTMHNVIHNPHVTYDALISRCIPVFYRLSPSDFKEILEGERQLFTPLTFASDPLTHIEWRDVEYVWSIVENSCLGQYQHLHNLIARTIGDLLRCFSILGKHDPDLYEFVIAMKSHLPNVRWLSQRAHGKAKRLVYP